jgi:parallel beta-helix repeat protein
MGNNERTFALLLTLMFVLSSLIIIEKIPFGIAVTGKNVYGSINSDTTWTHVNSPYNLVGSLTIQEGAVLTIEAGVIFNLKDHQLTVDGSFIVNGNDYQKVSIISAINSNFDAHFPDFNIVFSDKSYCLINNAIINNTDVLSAASLTISNSTLNEVGFLLGGESNVISNNSIKNENTMGLSVGGNKANNTIISDNKIIGVGLSVESKSAVISHNNITGYTGLTSNPIGADNIWGIAVGGDTNAIIVDNYVSNYTEACIYDTTTHSIIQRNIIENKISSGLYHYGFGIEVIGASPLIENNTISGNMIGLDIYDSISYNNVHIEAKPIIIKNNIYNNTAYNLYLGYPDGLWYQNASEARAQNVDASHNWWGTTDPEAISKTIYDSKNTSNLGKVTFTPFLTEYNPQALPDAAAPVPTLNQNSPINTLVLIIAIYLLLVISIFAVLLFRRHRKSTRTP